MRLFRAGLGLVVGAVLGSSPARADTIHLQDGSELKGVVVEEFADRLTLSTEEGERQVPADRIARVVYDTPERNYLRLGDQAFDRGVYDEAVRQYQRALTASPQSAEAQRRLVAAQAAIRRQRDETVRARVAQERAVVLWSRGQPATTAASVPLAQRLAQRLGVTLESRGDEAWVSRVTGHSAAHDAGLRVGDRIVAVWGRLTKYEPLETVMERLAEGPDHSEVQVTVERDVEVERRLAGIALGLSHDGLVVERLEERGAAAAAGLRPGDRVMALDGQSTRYLPVAEAQRLLEEGADAVARLTLRRDAAMWRRPLTSRGVPQ